MMSFRLCVLLLMWCAGAARAGVSPDIDLLSARFDDQPLNAQIGTGGATVGEPVSIAPGLQAFVIPDGLFPTPALRLTPVSGSGARLIRFEFLDSVEVTAGNVSISFVLKPAQLDRFLIYVREQGTSAENFLSLALLADGSIAVSDAGDPSGALIANYSAGANLAFELRFRMDGATYDIYLNGTALARNRSHAIVDRGVGAILLGPDSTSVNGNHWFIDDLHAWLPDLLQRNGFE